MVKSTSLSEGSVMELLELIPDPDIPVVSIVELGIVRGVAVDENNKVTVTITPTYSGCPAMTVFKEDIRELLLKNGAEDVEIKIAHSPTWSTDWLSESTREKLRAYGIAPPESNSSDSVPLFSSSKQKLLTLKYLKRLLLPFQPWRCFLLIRKINRWLSIRFSSQLIFHAAFMEMELMQCYSMLKIIRKH